MTCIAKHFKKSTLWLVKYNTKLLDTTEDEIQDIINNDHLSKINHCGVQEIYEQMKKNIFKTLLIIVIFA